MYPKPVQIIIEHCEKNIDSTVIRTLADMQSQLASSLPEHFSATDIADVANVIQYLTIYMRMT